MALIFTQIQTTDSSKYQSYGLKSERAFDSKTKDIRNNIRDSVGKLKLPLITIERRLPMAKDPSLRDLIKHICSRRPKVLEDTKTPEACIS